MDGRRSLIVKAYVDAGLFHAVNSQAHRERLTTSKWIELVLEEALERRGVPRLRSMLDSPAAAGVDLQLAGQSELQLVESLSEEG